MSEFHKALLQTAQEIILAGEETHVCSATRVALEKLAMNYHGASKNEALFKAFHDIADYVDNQCLCGANTVIQAAFEQRGQFTEADANRIKKYGKTAFRIYWINRLIERNWE